MSLSYGGNAQLFRQSTILPTLTGLQGHAPNCSLASGSLPTGMTLNSDCSITGIPTQSGSFPITVHLGAQNVSNTLDWNVAVLVMGPSVVYSVPSTMMAGSSYDVPPLNQIFWTATPADAITYSVAEGALPPGLTVDPTTGHITGTPTTGGTYTFKIGVQDVNAGRTGTAVERYEELTTVNVPTISYSSAQSYAGLPFSSAPIAPPTGYTFSAASLPPGLAIDPATGAISGTPTTLSGLTTYRITLTKPVAGSGTVTLTSDLSFWIQSPVSISWPVVGVHGLAFSGPPYVQKSVSDPLTGIAYSYALDPASALPTGLTLDATTGEISGTPSVAGNYTVRVNVTVTLYGTTFVQPVDVNLVIT